MSNIHRLSALLPILALGTLCPAWGESLMRLEGGKTYLGSVVEIGDALKFATCDQTVMDVKNGAALTSTGLRCLDAGRLDASAAGDEVLLQRYPWVPIPPPDCPTPTNVPPPNPAPNNIKGLLNAWKTLQENAIAINDPPFQQPSKGEEVAQYFGAVASQVETESWFSQKVDCRPKPKNPKGCPNCLEKLDYVLGSDTTWVEEFYNDNAAFIDRTTSSLNTKAHDVELHTLIDLYARQRMTVDYLQSLGR
jgi:hypothetical protein